MSQSKLYNASKRVFDVLSASLGVVVLSPILVLVSFVIMLDSGMPVLYRQERIGKKGEKFKILKFRTMVNNADKVGSLITSKNDSRVTKSGAFLRKFKLDELPQLFNVIKGDMSIVGPRPEVEKYTRLYDESQQQVLNVRPGITDYASIAFRNENDLIAGLEAGEIDRFYIETIMPEKLKYNMQYIKERSMIVDLKIIFKTLFAIVK